MPQDPIELELFLLYHLQSRERWALFSKKKIVSIKRNYLDLASTRCYGTFSAAPFWPAGAVQKFSL
jgi:hypothetical protein